MSTNIPRLLDQLRAVLRRKHYSLHTEEAHVGWIKRFALFHGTRHPQEMGLPEVEAFPTDPAIAQHVAASPQNQALSALLFIQLVFMLSPPPAAA